MNNEIFLKNNNFLKKCGYYKKYYKIVLSILLICNFTVGLVSYSIPMYYNEEKLLCWINNQWITCPYDLYKNEEEICNNFKYKILNNFDNLVKKYNLICDRKYIILLIKGLIPFLSSLFCFIFSFYSNKIGILKTFKITFTSMVIFLFLIFFEFNLFLTTLFFIIAKTGSNIFFSFSSIYIYEITENKNKILALNYSFYSFGGFFLNLIFINNFSYLYVNFIIFIFSCISLIGLYYIHDIPNFFLQKKNKKKFLESYLFILKKTNYTINKIEFNTELDFYYENYKTEEKLTDFQIFINNINKTALKTIFTEFQVFKRILIILFFYVNVNIINGILLYSNENLGLDNFVYNGLMVTGMEIIGYFITIIIYKKKLNPVKYMVITSIMVIFLGFVLLLFFILNLNNELKFYSTLISGIIKLILVGTVVTIFMFITELFPMKIKVYVLGIILFFARSAQFTCPYINNYSISLNLHPLIIPLLFLIIILPFFKFINFKNN